MMRHRENLSGDPSCMADDGVTELQDKVLGLLEDAGIPQDICDRMIMTLWRHENGVAPLEPEQKEVLWDIRDGPLPPYVRERIKRQSAEKIESAAVRYNDHIGVLALPRPARHHHVMWTRLLIDGQRTPGDAEQGFVTTSGRFVDRKEGLEIATRHGQIIKKHGNEGLLFSEDMWDTPPEARNYRIFNEDDGK